MKIEEVIKQLESIADHTRSMAASPDADEIWKEDSDALEFAITALRSMPEAGEPLSLEQLREMDGKPVWVEFIGHPDGTPIEPLWMLVNCREKRLVTDVEYVDWDFEGWFAYPYPPAHIDRSGWISVKERLPKTGTVLVTDGKIVITAPSSSVTKDGLAITHWMPLPEPPEEE